MDDSEIFRKMADHEKIQGLWEPKVGDQFWGVGQKELYIFVGKPAPELKQDCYVIPPSGGCHRYGFPAGRIWLPRQDQLQEMIVTDFGCNEAFNTYYLLDGFYKFLNLPKSAVELNSMERLWLAFVMNELHNLRWDGEWKEE